MKANHTVFLTRTAILLALALIFQIGLRALPFAQPFVGPLVNFVLIFAAIFVGTLSGVLIGILTPLIAFVVGIMPLFPVVPFIMIGNALLVIVFSIIKKIAGPYGEYIGVFCGALAKFAFLAISVRHIITLFIKVPPPVVVALSLPQLYTALTGGLAAIIVAKIFSRAFKGIKSS